MTSKTTPSDPIREAAGGELPDKPESDNQKGLPHIQDSTFEGKEMRFSSGKMAIVDGALLDAVDHPLKKEALVVPVKDKEVTFVVNGEFDDSVMLSLSIEPKYDAKGDMEDGARAATEEPGDVVVKPEGEAAAEMKEGALPDMDPLGNSNDSSLERKTRMTPKQVTHQGGKDLEGGKLPHAFAKPRRDNKGANDHVRRAGQHEDVASFILDRMGKPLTEEDLKLVEDKDALWKSLHTLLTMSVAGWERKTYQGKPYLEHPWGVRIMSEAKWTVEEGYLVDRETKSRPDFDFDWLFEARAMVNNVRS